MSNATYDLCEKLTGEQAALEARQEREALQQPTIESAHKAGYGLHCHELEAMAVNLRAFSRGMVSADVLPSYLQRAREALDGMQGALSAREAVDAQ
jgi:hypothetical protein